MDNFNMKQWLQENKIGPYSKTLLNEMNPAALGVGQAEADAEMQKKDDENGDWVDNASMDVVAEYKTQRGVVDMKDYEITILGKDYMMDVEADVEYHMESPDYEDHYQINPGGIVLDKATATVKKLAIGDEDEYRDINDPAAIKQIQDLLNTDKRINRQFEDDVADTSDFYELGAGDDSIDETVGYAMKTAPENNYIGRINDADDIDTFVKDIILSNFNSTDIPPASIPHLISNLQTKFEEGNINTYEELETEVERMVKAGEVRKTQTPGTGFA